MHVSDTGNLLTENNRSTYKLSVPRSITSMCCRFCSSENLNIYGIMDLDNFSNKELTDWDFDVYFDVLTIFHCSSCNSYFSINNSARLIRPIDVLDIDEIKNLSGKNEAYLDLEYDEEKGVREFKNKICNKCQTYTDETISIICEANIALNMGFEDLASAGYRKGIELICYDLAKQHGISTTTKKGDPLRLNQLLINLKDKNGLTETEYRKMLAITYLGNDSIHAGKKRHVNYGPNDMKELVDSLLEEEHLKKKSQAITKSDVGKNDKN
ncbi:hypothetical protein [uncultured Enterococcus sp.]|uniref:hypothetical protein n=1 Tax=uncultured Enterococcus sp. TaxID=167972 RepID=UPI002AA8B1BB|nr:hypothetical protein [uncultured Enterococcus sp.]